MMNVLVEKAEVVQDELHQESRKDYKKLKGDIKAQRDENELLYKDMKKLIHETESQRAKVAMFTAKIEELEQHVGILANDPGTHISAGSPEHAEEPTFDHQVVNEITKAVHEGELTRDSTILGKLKGHTESRPEG